MLCTRALRSIGYGWLSVALALVLSERGYSSAVVGAFLALALAAGAAFSASTGPLARRFGSRRTLIAAACMMAVSGVLLGMGSLLTTCAAFVLGTVSAGTQEVGPFAPLEQTIIASTVGSGATAAFGRYNIVGGFMVALGAAIPSVIPTALAPWGYSLLGLALAALYTTLPEVQTRPDPVAAEEGRAAYHPSRAVEKLATLFALDAFGGGIVVQGFLVYWFVTRFGVDARTVGALFFCSNALAACSLLLAAPVVRRIGIIRTMVVGNIPTNLLLMLVPLMPTFALAALAMLARAILSQLDIPARQALVMTIVPPHERPRAAGITNAVRPAAGSIGPLIAGFAVQASALGLPFFLSGSIKTVYALALLAQFHDLDAKIAGTAQQEEKSLPQSS